MQFRHLFRSALFVVAMGLLSGDARAGIGDCSTHADCQDDNPCTVDTCNAGFCDHTNEPDNTPCPDEFFCNGRERCEGGVCADRVDACIDLDHCDEVLDVCLDCLSNEECDDTNDCTDDLCILNVCTHITSQAGTPCGDPSDNDCDDPDTCDGSGTCLANVEPEGAVCRSAVNECDVDEVCNGTDPGCPPDDFADSGTPCGDPSDTDCDNPDSCDGAGACLDNLEPATTICREAVDECDVEESCTGADAECPTDAFADAGAACGDGSDTDCDDPDTCDGTGACLANLEPDTTVCRPAVDDCDAEERCTGSDAECPSDEFAESGTPCGDGSDTDCDNPDTCDGNGACLDNYEPVDTACGDGSDTSCDNPDTCDGTGACLDNLEPPTTVCREAVDECDIEESCTGADADCPADAFATAGTSCGDPSNTLCDFADTCDGSGNCEDNHADDGTPCPDDAFCNGSESCRSGECAEGNEPCLDRDHCDENADECLDCISDAECDDGSECTEDACADNVCVNTPLPSCGIDARLDIRPGSCPNPISRRSKGVIPVAILGSDLLDVMEIDIESIEMRRADGLGGVAVPLTDRRGLKVSTYDTASAADGEECECSTLGGDGHDDLVMKFSTQDFVEAFDLASEEPGMHVELTVSGSLLDGTGFSASDCVRVVPISRR